MKQQVVNMEQNRNYQSFASPLADVPKAATVERQAPCEDKKREARTDKIIVKPMRIHRYRRF